MPDRGADAGRHRLPVVENLRRSFSVLARKVHKLYDDAQELFFSATRPIFMRLLASVAGLYEAFLRIWEALEQVIGPLVEIIGPPHPSRYLILSLYLVYNRR